jgi:hypothetical protein
MRAVHWAAVVMLGWLVGCGTSAGARAGAAPGGAAKVGDGKRVGMVLLAQPGLPAQADVVSAFAALAPASQAAPKPGQVREHAQAFDFADGAFFLVMEMPGPVPAGEAERVAEYSLARMSESWKLPEQRAHLVVLMVDAQGRAPLETQRRFTWAVAAVTQATPGATGVYFGDGHVTHPRDFFLTGAKGDALVGHVTVWNGVSVASDGPGRVSLVSLGMEALGQPNLRVTAPKEKASEATQMLFDLLTYAAGRGAAVPEGETVGRDAQQILPVHYEPSPVESGKQVWRVDLP